MIKNAKERTLNHYKQKIIIVFFKQVPNFCKKMNIYREKFQESGNKIKILSLNMGIVMLLSDECID